MKKCKQVKTLRAKDLTELETLINKELMEGAELGAIDLALCVAMVVVTEYVGDIKKTLLDELEDELGRHNCSECPFFVESTDKRKNGTLARRERESRSHPRVVSPTMNL